AEYTLDTVDQLDARQFEIAVKRLADSLSYGTDKSPFVGSGVEYVQSRRYLPGDPVRAIDWRVTARTGKYHIKEYETPKSLPVFLCIDTSASMTVGSTKRTKYATAVHIAAGIATACLERVSPAGVLGLGERDFRIEPSLSRERILQWLHQLRRYRVDERTTLSRRLAELGVSLKNRAVIIVLSDLHDPGALPALKRIGQMHDTVVMQMRDPAEEGVTGAGFLRAREVETGREVTVRASQSWVDDGAVKSALRRAGIDHLLIRTDKPFIHLLRYFFKNRALLGSGAR
ncbi:MAG: DUF58 domain-containing protein, partial [Planctomycetota bacterium]